MTYGVSTNRRWDSSVAVPIFYPDPLLPRAAMGRSYARYLPINNSYFFRESAEIMFRSVRMAFFSAEA